MSKMDEIVLVTPTDKLFEETGRFQGIVTDRPSLDSLYDSFESSTISMRRGDAEENFEYKQPIPYVIIKRGEEYFSYERLSGSGENRLHNKISIGVGGHMNPESDSFKSSLMMNLLRELSEEVDIQTDETLSVDPFGVLNSDEDDVSKVHIGLLCKIDLPQNSTVEVLETEQLKGSFKTREELMAYDNLEPWSAIALSHFHSLSEDDSNE